MTKSRHSDLIDNHIFRSAEVGCGILLYTVLSHNHGHRQSKCQVSESSSSSNDRNDHQMTKEAILPQTDRGWHLEKVRTFGGLEASTTRSYPIHCSLQRSRGHQRRSSALQTRQHSLRNSVLGSCYPLPKILRIELYSAWISEYDMTGEALGLNSSSRCSARTS